MQPRKLKLTEAQHTFVHTLMQTDPRFPQVTAAAMKEMRTSLEKLRAKDPTILPKDVANAIELVDVLNNRLVAWLEIALEYRQALTVAERAQRRRNRR